MKKGQRRKDNAAKRKHPQRTARARKALRKNPAWPAPVFELPEGAEPIKSSPLPKFLHDSVGNLAVIAALQGCTLNEKVAIAAMIPMFIKLVRGKAKPTNDGASEADGGELRVSELKG